LGTGPREIIGDRLLDGIDQPRFHFVSSDTVRSTLVVLEPVREPSEAVVGRLKAGHVHVAHRQARIRLSPHMYNMTADIDRALNVLG
jgi:selenocysteine lyase/cysteine desulfurase